MAVLPDALLARIEDAGLNASAVPQQRWLDGWLLRCSPGKIKRGRCINALADGRLALDERLALARAAFAEAGLPTMFRLTPFTRPGTLDAELAARGFAAEDDTRVMVRPSIVALALPPLPPHLQWRPLDAAAFAETVGTLRGSPPEHRRVHAERLARSPVPYRAFALADAATGAVLCCGQVAREGALVGVYDVFTAPQARGQRLAGLLCERMLSLSAREGAEVAYLQVDAVNAAARAVYGRLGFADVYAYHYRVAPAGAR
ncbi:MAG: GNAT family N-acetyltransferase [Rubrivivax sp.]|nr:GNAT family N-acetyltransferase [Rubrivivax sp.]